MLENLRNAARRAVVTLLVIYWLIIFAGTHLPFGARAGIHLTDKLLHFLAYCGLGFLLAWTALRLRPTWAGILMLLTVIAGYGLADELSQAFVPHRSTEVLDWVADFCGGTVGLGFYFVSCRLCARWVAPSCTAAALIRNDAA